MIRQNFDTFIKLCDLFDYSTNKNYICEVLN